MMNHIRHRPDAQHLINIALGRGILRVGRSVFLITFYLHRNRAVESRRQLRGGIGRALRRGDRAGSEGKSSLGRRRVAEHYGSISASCLGAVQPLVRCVHQFFSSRSVPRIRRHADGESDPFERLPGVFHR
jgi:hypothetical protein